MAGTQTDNLLLLDLTTGLSRTPETGGTPDDIATSVDWAWTSGANVVIDGNLTVNGTTTTVHSEQINVRDNHLYLNADYTTVVAQTGGLVINVLPTATVDTVAGAFVAGIPAGANPTVITGTGGIFAAGDVIQIAGSNNQDNDGIFEVLSHVGTTLTIKGVGTTGATVPWVVNQFTADTVAGGDIRVVNVNVLEGDSTGTWSTATVTNTTGITYVDLTTQGLVDLQEAYEQGNTITTSAGEGNVTIGGTELLNITATGGLDLDTILDFDGTGFDVQMTGSNGFSLDGTAASNVSVTAGNLDLTTITSGDVNVSSAGELDLDAVTTMVLNTADAADASGNDITVTAASSTAGTADGASIILTPGDGFTTGVAGFVNITSPADEDEILLQLESTGSGANAVGLFTGTSVPSGSVTADAGSLFMRDTGTGGEVYVNTSTGSGTSWTLLTAGGGNSLQAAYAAGNTIVTNAGDGDLDVSGTEAISLDASAASNFTVAGANLDLGTTTSGDVNVSAAGELDLDAVTTMVLNTANAADASANDITITAASSTAGTADGASIILTPGDGFTTGVAGSVDILGPNDEDEALVTLTTTGTNGDSVGLFVGDSDPSGSITALAGSLFFRDTGSGAELYLNQSSGSGTTWTALSTGGAVTLQNAYVNGNTITTSAGEGDVTLTGTEDFVVTLSDMLVDTTASISLDADAASNFTVAGANLTLETTTSGTVDINSAADIDITFAAANSAAMVVDDGSNTYMTFDSTVAEPAVEVSQFLDIVGSGAGVTLTAGEAIVAGDVLTIEATSGDAILADSNTGTTLDGLAIGVAAFAAADTAPVKVYTVAGNLIPVSFSAAPAAASNGSPVFVSATPGRATLTAPTGSGNVVYLLGILQGADGADTSPLVLFQPQFIAVRP